MILQYVFNLLVSCGFVAAGVLYLDFFSFGKTERNILLICRRNKRLLIITAVFFTAFTYLSTAFAVKRGYTEYSLLRNLFFIYALYFLSVTDIRKKVIPNKIILSVFIMRFVFLLAEIYYNSEMVALVLKNALVGLAISVFVAVVMLLISRNQMGGGDVKLFALIGFYTGRTNVLSVMMFSFIYAALAGIILMLSKKYKAKDSIPMAPFVFLGMMTYFILVYFVGLEG